MKDPFLVRKMGVDIFDTIPSTSQSTEKIVEDKTVVRTFKVIVIGDSNVGKTCFTERACAGRFPTRTEATIGVDFREKTLLVGDENVKLQLWDSAGQERFRHSLVPQYYRNVHAVMFVYDVTRKSSFDNLRKWLDEFHFNVGISQNVPQLIIGNKCDLHSDREVRTSEAKVLANSYGLPMWETSAKSDLESDTIESIFQSLAETLKLKTPLLEFPAHYSSAIQSYHHRGLRVNESLSHSSESLQKKRKKMKLRKNYNRTGDQDKKSSCCLIS